MIKIKFNNSTDYHPCDFSRLSDHVVTLSNCKIENTSGFCTYRMSGEQLGDFSDYITVYRALDNAVQYSNDGSVYIDPQPEPTPDPEPEPTPDPKPSEMDRIAAQTIYTALMTDTLLEEGNGNV